MNSSKIFLTILLIIVVCVCSCNQPQQTKEESVNQKLELRGIRLGMSSEELKSKYPKFTEETDPNNKVGVRVITLDLKDVPELKGLELVTVLLLDEKVYLARFKYGKEFGKLSNAELTEQFEEFLGLKNMRCDPRWTGIGSGFVRGIWNFSKTAYLNYDMSTYCKPYFIKIFTKVGEEMLLLKDEDKSSVLDKREDEIKKAKATPKTFQP
jgi:hypothetical protein